MKKMQTDVGRRKALKKIAVSVGVLAGCAALPERWIRPIVGNVVLPAHAATSGSTLHDPCAVELRGGDSSSASVTIKVTGFVTPPTGNLSTTITATAVGGLGLSANAEVKTAADGTFEAFLTLGGGPGITSVNVVTSVQGAAGTASCTVHTTAQPQLTITCEPFIGPGSSSYLCGSSGVSGVYTTSALITPNPGPGKLVVATFYKDGNSVEGIFPYTDVNGRVSVSKDLESADWRVLWEYSGLSCSCSITLTPT
jgi:hypothetical protein